MATGLRLVWSSPAPRAPGSPPLAGSPPSPAVAEARALVDDWVCAGFEDGSTAIEDLVVRIASALTKRRVALVAEEMPLRDASEPG
jgi:hypothetical protein